MDSLSSYSWHRRKWSSAGVKDLFKNRWTIICENKDINKNNLKIKILGISREQVKSMTLNEHDHILALTSHLPHAVAYNIVLTAITADEKFRDDIIKYSAGG